MPALLVINACEHANYSGTFESEVLDYAVEGTYDWFTLTLLGINPGPPETASYSWQVLNNAPIGTYEIQLSPGNDYITVVVTDCSIEVDICLLTSGSIGPLDPPVEGDAWDTFSSDGCLNTTVFFNVETQTLTYLFTGEGTHWITLQSNGNPEEYLIYTFVITNCFIDDTNCTDYPLKIKWLNQTGGFSSYVFGVKKIYGVDIGGSATWKDSDSITRYLRHDNVYDTVIQASGFIPETHLDYLKDLKTSIAAWVEFDLGSDDIEDKPIFNYAKTFEFKRQANGFYKYDIEFSYSEEIQTQTP